MSQLKKGNKLMLLADTVEAAASLPNGYNLIFGTIHVLLLIVIFFLTFGATGTILGDWQKYDKILWKVKAVCSPILIGTIGLSFIGIAEDVITGLGALTVECCVLIILGCFFGYYFFIKGDKSND